jgi:Flp pilus assembly protein TadB
MAVGLFDLGEGVVVLLVVALVASIAAGSLLMIAVCLLLLTLFGALWWRARVIGRRLERAGDQSRPR